MKILALETATDPGSIALWLDGRLVARDCPRELSNSASLLPAAEAALREEGLGFSDLDGIAFGMGPGSFTGLRVSCGVAQGLAVARDLPLLGVGTLDAMALAAGGGRVIVALDARMGEVYCAPFEWHGGAWRAPQDFGLCAPEAVAPPPGFTVAGNAQAAYPGRLAPGAAHVHALPTAAALLRLAPALIAEGRAVPAAEALPRYIRDKVAQTTAEREAAKAHQP